MHKKSIEYYFLPKIKNINFLNKYNYAKITSAKMDTKLVISQVSQKDLENWIHVVDSNNNPYTVQSVKIDSD